MDRARIKEIFLAHGFKEKLQERGLLTSMWDLNPYVYEAAEALLKEAAAPVDQPHPDAARLDWLTDYAIVQMPKQPQQGHTLREAIDAAMKAKLSKTKESSMDIFDDEPLVPLTNTLPTTPIRGAKREFIEHALAIGGIKTFRIPRTDELAVAKSDIEEARAILSDVLHLPDDDPAFGAQATGGA
jgi:hypothetical protein